MVSLPALSLKDKLRKPRLWGTPNTQKHASSSSETGPPRLYTRSVRWSQPLSSPASTTSSGTARKPQSDGMSTASLSSSTSAASDMSLETTDATAVRVKVRTLKRRTNPPLRRSSSPTEDSLREICRRKQSEENLRSVYEAQTLAYLNDAIQF